MKFKKIITTSTTIRFTFKQSDFRINLFWAFFGLPLSKLVKSSPPFSLILPFYTLLCIYNPCYLPPSYTRDKRIVFKCLCFLSVRWNLFIVQIHGFYEGNGMRRVVHWYHNEKLHRVSQVNKPYKLSNALYFLNVTW